MQNYRSVYEILQYTERNELLLYLIAVSLWGKERARSESRGIFQKPHLNFKSTYVRRKQPAWTKNEICVASIPRNALSRTRSFTEFMTAQPKISVPLFMQIRKRKICTDADHVWFRGCVCGRACINFFSSHRASTCTSNSNSPDILSRSLLVLSFAFSTYFSDVRTFCFPRTLLGENNSGRTNKGKRWGKGSKTQRALGKLKSNPRRIGWSRLCAGHVLGIQKNFDRSLPAKIPTMS